MTMKMYCYFLLNIKHGRGKEGRGERGRVGQGRGRGGGRGEEGGKEKEGEGEGGGGPSGDVADQAFCLKSAPGTPLVPAVLCGNLVATCTQDRRLWIWIWMEKFISTASLKIYHRKSSKRKLAFSTTALSFDTISPANPDEYQQRESKP